MTDGIQSKMAWSRHQWHSEETDMKTRTRGTNGTDGADGTGVQFALFFCEVLRPQS